MTEFSFLWMPIFLSSIGVFIVSSIIHMALPWHKGEYPGLPDQDKIMDALRPFNIPPGEYMMPRAASHKDMSKPEFLEKLKKGPVGLLTIWTGSSMSMTPSLIQWFVYSVCISIFAAYVAGRALSHGASYLEVFRFSGVTAFIGYAAALWQMPIWYKRSWRVTATSTLDGLIYGLVTAGFFGWLWPR